MPLTSNRPKFCSLLLALNLVLLMPVMAQKKNANFRIHIAPATSPITVDGVLDEQAWKDAEKVSDFYMVLPMDTSKAKVRTDVQMTYDHDRIYLAATCYTNEPGRYMVESMRRDFAFQKNDNFLVFIDPFEDQTNGFSFGVNAAGAQWDGLMYEGGKVDLSWDNKWTSAVKNYDDRYVLEMAIPFKTMRYKKGLTDWGINFSRNDLKTTEKSSWAPVPRQFPTAALAYTGVLVWDQPPPIEGKNISFIPYALGGLAKDYENDTPTSYKKEVGADAKVAVTSSLNLDLTVNPDFSQVEVDQQVTNLDRYELFFPEKRQFFLENGDLFANFGYDNIRPFFSRRIGLNTPIQFGARLSGKLTKDWRLGAMDIQTGSEDSLQVPVQNFSVLALQRKVFARSNIGMMFVNKTSVNYTPPTDPSAPIYSQYNRNLGFEYNLASSNNLWTGKALFIKSFTPNTGSHDFVQAGNLQYLSRHWLLSWEHEYVGSDYQAEVGYVPRTGYIKVNPKASYLFFPKGTSILSHGPIVSSTYYFNEAFHQTDNETYLNYTVTFRNRGVLDGWVAHDYVELLQPFDPTNSGKDSLQTGSRHLWDSFGGDFTSQPQHLFTYGLTFRYGGYYDDGTRLNITTSLGYRIQPIMIFAINTSYNEIHLPQPWGQTTFWLVGPRLDFTFTNNLYFTTFVQYNQQQNNVNLNTRLQWRYRPASDLFIVYTDNYLPDQLLVKTRALVIKLTYWLNM